MKGKDKKMTDRDFFTWFLWGDYGQTMRNYARERLDKMDSSAEAVKEKSVRGCVR